MPRHCERPACSAHATVAYVIDPSITVVRLEAPIPGDASRMNVLCRRHADSLVVPKGWTIDDKREKEPRLFSAPAKPRPAKQKRGDATPSRGGRRRKSAPTSPELFDPEETKALPWTPQFDHSRPDHDQSPPEY